MKFISCPGQFFAQSFLNSIDLLYFSPLVASLFSVLLQQQVFQVRLSEHTGLMAG